SPDTMEFRPVLALRYEGTDTALPVDFGLGSISDARTDFERAHKAQFGFVYDGKTVVVESVSVEGTDRSEGRNQEASHEAAASPARASETRPVFFEGSWRDTGVFRREDLFP